MPNHTNIAEKRKIAALYYFPTNFSKICNWIFDNERYKYILFSERKYIELTD